METIDSEELCRRIITWSNSVYLNWDQIKPLILQIDQDTHVGRMMLSHLMRVAIERDQLACLQDALVDNVPFFDADIARLRIGNQQYEVNVVEAEKGMASVRLADVPIRYGVVPEYQPHALHMSMTSGSYCFYMPFDSRAKIEPARYVAWFRAFYQHHVIDGLPHHIQSNDIGDGFDTPHIRLLFKPPGDWGAYWHLLVWESRGKTQGPHNAMQVGRCEFFL